MAVIIKNMEIPKSCSSCKLEYDSIGCIVTGHRYEDIKDFDEYEIRMPDCPLIEIKDDVT